MTFDKPASLRLIKEALELVHVVGDATEIRVRNVEMGDRMLVVNVYSHSVEPIQVRAVIAGVMGGLSGLSIPELFPALLPLDTFGVRAYDMSDVELLWVVSSIEAAGFAANGSTVEWLTNSLFQDNTPAYRHTQADRIIGQVETSLRDLLHLHARSASGDSYAAHLWTADELKKLRKAARSEGADETDPRTLLNYLFLPGLKEKLIDPSIACSDHCLPESTEVDEALSKLNKVRRKVAHHRDIDSSDLETCESVRIAIMVGIGEAHPDIASCFLSDRWDDEVQLIMDRLADTFDASDPPVAGSMPEPERRSIALNSLRDQHSALARAHDGLSRLTVPATRATLHSEAIRAIDLWCDALQSLIDVGSQPSLSASQTEAAARDYERAIQDVATVRERIQLARLSIPRD